MRTRGSVSWRAMDSVGSPFYQEQGLCPTLLVTHEGLLCIDHVRYAWSWTICGLNMKSVWCVGRVFPCRVYIDSNRRDSRI
jgi:hypothetical protein